MENSEVLKVLILYEEEMSEQMSHHALIVTIFYGVFSFFPKTQCIRYCEKFISMILCIEMKLKTQNHRIKKSNENAAVK